MTSLSLIVATHRDDRPLSRCLASVAGQLQPDDEVLVIGDTYDGSLPGVERVVKGFGSQFRYHELDAGHHCWGHCQINKGLELASGDYIHMNDDDDVWTPNALYSIRQGIKAFAGKVLLYRFESYYGRQVYWLQPGLMQRDYIGGHCLVFPNDELKGKLGCEYNGDYDVIEQTVNNHGGPGEAAWITDLVAIARPA